ncbi:hypothetical protein [Clostridium beijerinckii]|uniref:hypothetical protein n=1 Tax=Clostridium beijerinckii TaxID=1520 RepID=UPI00156E363E|nr:hypothetical protein [Clostridium beijerinckii]
MEIDEKRLRELVIKAIQLLQAESSIQNLFIPRKKLYVIFTEEWNNKYSSLFEELDKRNEYEVYAVLPDGIYNDFHLSNLKKFSVCKSVISRQNADFDESSEYLTVFPVVPREIVVKTALCIDDIFESRWIFKSMEKGQRIILLSSGLEKFTGKEPPSYINKILNYYKTLLEFNIEITKDIFQIEEYENKFSENSFVVYESTEYNEVLNNKDGKRIITVQEIERYKNDKKLFLYSGDIITELAKDKAKNLNIQIIRRS